MANTRFSISAEETVLYDRDIRMMAKDRSLIMQFAGTSPESPIQLVKDFSMTHAGAKCVLQMVHDIESDGAVGEADLEGHEAMMSSSKQTIRVDMLRQAVREAGGIENIRTLLTVRGQGKARLAKWRQERWDHLAILTLAGMAYDRYPDGRPRLDQGEKGYRLTDLEFAQDVKVPSAERHFQADGDKVSSTLDLTALKSTDVLKMKHLVRLKEHAELTYMEGASTKSGNEHYILLINPAQLADLELDPDFVDAQQHAGMRGRSNPLFNGLPGDWFMLRGLTVVSHRYVPSTIGAYSGTVANAGQKFYKWGANAQVNGASALLLGQQALGFADIEANEFVEKLFDYDSKLGMATGGTIGILKPQWPRKLAHPNAAGVLPMVDKGVIRFDTAVSNQTEVQAP